MQSVCSYNSKWIFRGLWSPHSPLILDVNNLTICNWVLQSNFAHIFLHHSYHSIEDVHFFINNAAKLSINVLYQTVPDTVRLKFKQTWYGEFLPHVEVECLAQVNHRMVIRASPNSWLVRIEEEFWCNKSIRVCQSESVIFKVAVKTVQPPTEISWLKSW